MTGPCGCHGAIGGTSTFCFAFLGVDKAACLWQRLENGLGGVLLIE